MRSSLINACLLALTAASTAVAQIAGFDVFTAPSTAGTNISAGTTYTIKWTPTAPAGKISIYLLEGSSNITLNVGTTIATSIDSVAGSYDWQVPNSVPAFPYFGFKLQLDSDPMTFQYSTYFSITGLTASSSGVATTTVASTSITVQVSQVGATAVTTSTISAMNSTMNSTSATSTAAGVFPNSTMTTITSTSKTAAGTAGTSTAATTSASATSSSSASGAVIVGGTGLMGAVFVALGMLL